MSPPRTWKKIESKVAALFGTRRRRASGADPYLGGDDVVLPDAFVEIRYRKRYKVVRWWDEDVVKPAKYEKKFPVLVLVRNRYWPPFVLAPLDVTYLERLARLVRRGKVPRVSSAKQLDRQVRGRNGK